MNLIDRDKLIEKVKNHNYCRRCPYSDECYVADDEQITCEKFMIMDIKEQPTANEWIPVSKRLPKDNNKVVIKDVDGDVYVARHVNGNWDCLYFAYDYEDVIAWMPIPPFEEDVPMEYFENGGI